MGGYLRQPGGLSGGIAKRRKFWLMAATALAPLSVGVSEPALAQCSGPTSAVTCDANGNTYSSPIAGNPYQSNPAGGINVDTTFGNTLINLQLLQGVNVVIPAGAGGVNAVNAANTTGVSLGSADINITADGVSINNTANPNSNNNTGLRIQSSGAAIIN